jgi:hypothetical protein
MNDSTSVPEAQPTPGKAAMPSRRRLLRGGLAVAPVMMTLASRPVRAGGTCTTASAFASVNLSGLKAESVCGGSSPTRWQSNSNWPAGLQANGKNATQFSAVFPAGGTYPEKSILDVMKMNGTTGTSGVARYLSAAYLNAAAKLTPDRVLNQATAVGVWSSFISKGYYEPTAGVRWNSDQIIAWISSTMA